MTFAKRWSRANDQAPRSTPRNIPIIHTPTQGRTTRLRTRWTRSRAIESQTQEKKLSLGGTRSQTMNFQSIRRTHYEVLDREEGVVAESVVKPIAVVEPSSFLAVNAVPDIVRSKRKLIIMKKD